MTRDDKKQSLKKWNKVQPRRQGKNNEIETSRLPHHGDDKPRSKAWDSSKPESDDDDENEEVETFDDAADEEVDS